MESQIVGDEAVLKRDPFVMLSPLILPALVVRLVRVVGGRDALPGERVDFFKKQHVLLLELLVLACHCLVSGL